MSASVSCPRRLCVLQALHRPSLSPRVPVYDAWRRHAARLVLRGLPPRLLVDGTPQLDQLWGHGAPRHSCAHPALHRGAAAAAAYRSRCGCGHRWAGRGRAAAPVWPPRDCAGGAAGDWGSYTHRRGQPSALAALRPRSPPPSQPSALAAHVLPVPRQRAPPPLPARPLGASWSWPRPTSLCRR